MKNQRVGTIVLTGQDSINFVNSLIRASLEQIDHFKKVFQRIDNTIQINDNEDGFIKSSAKEFIDSVLALQDIEKQRKFAKSAYDKVIANYSIDALEQNKIAIINDILKNNNNDY